MKKSMLNMLTLALLVVNLVLSIVMVFSIVPASNKTSDMITKVCAALDLELEGGSEGKKDYKIEQLEEIAVEDEMTIEVKSSEGDSTKHYGAITFTLIVDKEHEDYGTYSGQISTKMNLIKDAVRGVIGSFTIEEIRSNQDGVQKAVLDKLQKLFDSDFIVNVAYPKWLFQ